MLARAAAHPCEAVLQDPASEVLLHHTGHDLSPVTPAPRQQLVVDGGEFLEVIPDQALQRRGPGSPRSVDTCWRGTTPPPHWLRCTRCRSHEPVAPGRKQVSWGVTG